MSRLLTYLLVLTCFTTLVCHHADAQVTAEQRKELYQLTKDLKKVASHVRKKEFDEAEKILTDTESKVAEIAEAAMVETSDRAFAGIVRAIGIQRGVLDKAQGNKPSNGVSFVDDVAPLIDQRCLGCHGDNNPRSGLNLSTFNGWKQGGRSGPLLVPGAATRSLLVARLSAPQGQGGMPARGEQLSREEIGKIATWINTGAKFDGSAENAPLADLIFEREKKTMDIKIPKPKGGETVSFTRDIAPFMSNLCLGCHNARNKSGGLSVATFFDLMKGGDSGEVIIPGDMENSRFFRLVGGLELPRMPQGQARITRKNYEDMKQWFREGNAYDGSDPRTPINTFVQTPAQMLADKFAAMSKPEMEAYRKERSQDQLKRTVPNDGQSLIESEHFLMLGNVSQDRLQEAEGWAKEHLDKLHKLFGGSGSPWRGRLAVFVVKDRFSYDEFNEVIESRRAEPEISGHAKVTPSQEDAYVVVQDTGDDSSSGKSLQFSLVEQVTSAYLQQDGSTLPGWLQRGTSIMMASSLVPGKQFTQQMKKTASEIVPTLSRPDEVFNDGAFSPAMLGSVGYTMVDFLIDSAGTAKFAQLVQSLQRGQSINDAIQRAYGTNADAIARAYIQNLGK